MTLPTIRYARGLAFSLLFSLTLSSCGGSEEKNTDTFVLPPIQASLNTTAQTQQIPLEVLAAVIYKESGLSPFESSNLYGPGNVSLGPKSGETAFGLPRATLGLDDSVESRTIPVQVAAYGAWVRKQLDGTHLELSQSLEKPDDVYDWVWQLARMHYPDVSAPKNLQIIFAMELIKILNSGFIWQDPNSDEHLELKARTPELAISSFSAPIQANLQLDTTTSELYSVDYLQLSYYNEITIQNRPRRILVKHCPFTLSNCLAAQLDNTNAAALQAHYVIAPDQTVLPRPVKILQHSVPVKQVNDQGQVEDLTDAIVIMLIGNSGRYIDSQRTQINPNWYTKSQLRELGKIVQGLCQALPKENPTMTPESCSAINSGVVFSDPARHSRFQFGDIADYDPVIFGSLMKDPLNINGDLSATLPNNLREFPAGSNIPLQLTFIKGTAKVEIQRLERCLSGKTVWTTQQTVFLRSVTSKTIDLNFFDQGPNGNGQHFVRALASAGDGSFMGWATLDFFLSGFEKNASPEPSNGVCE